MRVKQLCIGQTSHAPRRTPSVETQRCRAQCAEVCAPSFVCRVVCAELRVPSFATLRRHLCTPRPLMTRCGFWLRAWVFRHPSVDTSVDTSVSPPSNSCDPVLCVPRYSPRHPAPHSQGHTRDISLPQTLRTLPLRSPQQSDRALSDCPKCACATTTAR